MYDTLNGAVADFHKKLGTAMSSDLYTSSLIMAVNSEGGIYKNETWTRPSETVETAEAVEE